MVILGLLLGLAARDAAAQEPLFKRFVQNKALRCAVVDGRVTFNGTRLGNMRSTSTNPQRKAAFRIQNDNGRITLNYDETTDTQQLTIEAASSDDRLMIRRIPRGSSSAIPVTFSQRASEKTSLALGEGDARQLLEGGSLWHLLILYPKECRQHLIPLLEMLRPDWKLTEAAANVEATMLREARAHGAPNRTRWDELVRQLADNDFAKREAADRALRRGNAAAITYLRQLDFSHLDAEQQFRIRRIVESVERQTADDSAELAAASLAGDPLIWLTLVSRPDPATRHTAARQLAALLGEPISIDPAADPDSQTAQRNALRAKIERRP